MLQFRKSAIVKNEKFSSIKVISEIDLYRLCQGVLKQLLK